MKVTVDSADSDVTLVRVEGQVSQRDVALTDPIAEALGADGFDRRLAIDMSEVASLDSSGVNWLLVRQKQTHEAGGRIVLHSLSPIALNVLKVLNLHTIFQIANSQDEAVRLLGDA